MSLYLALTAQFKLSPFPPGPLAPNPRPARPTTPSSRRSFSEGETVDPTDLGIAINASIRSAQAGG